MCYSFESSYNGWFYTLFGVFVLLYQNPNKTNVWISLFVITFTQIQLIEAMIWTAIDSGDRKKADELARYLVPLLWLQPLVQTFGGYAITGNNFLLYLSVFYLAMLITQKNEAFSKNNHFKITISKKGHLIWNRYDANGNKYESFFGNKLFRYTYLMGLWFAILFIEDEFLKAVSLGFIFISLIYTKQTFADDEFSSMWCARAVQYITVANMIQIIR